MSIRWLRGFRVCVALAGGLLLGCPGALALNPELDVSQYAHTSWKIREGFARGRLNAIAQTPDGYLWIGTEFGLVRFDGVRPVEWQPPTGQALPDNYIRSVFAARDGTLWIGTLGGLASWKDGRLTSYQELAGKVVDGLLEDREGTIWVGSGSVSPDAGRLCAIRSGKVHCYGEDGIFGQWVGDLHEDPSGRLWVSSTSGLWQWRPGPPKLVAIPDSMLSGFQSLTDDGNGALLVATRGSIRRLVEGKVEAFPMPGGALLAGTSRLLRDRDGGLWIGNSSKGLLHVHQGRVDVFTRSGGLSGDYVNRMLEDREGNLWVTTENGLDRFREISAHTVAVDQELSSAVIASVLAARDGSVWISTNAGLNRWHDGRMTVYRERSSVKTALREAQPWPAHEVVAAQLPDRGAGSLLQDSRGRIWLATRQGVGYLEQDRFTAVGGFPEGYPDAIVEDKQGYLWVANRNRGLLRLSPDQTVRLLPWTSLGRNEPTTRLVADPFLGGLWAGYFTGGIAYLADGQLKASYSAADGLGKGRVNGLRVDHEGTLWAATEGGLSRVKNGRVATLTSRNGLPCDSIHTTIEDDLDGFWLYAACGFVRIARSELRGWAAAADRGEDGKRKIAVRLLDGSDGVQAAAAMTSYSPHLVKSADGKLWFAAKEGAGVIDPRRLPHNALPPPVHIERVVADRQPYDATRPGATDLNLPPLVRDVQIDYTATSLVAPEKMRFRYKLEGHERDWQEAGTRRQAFYNDLPPGSYRFRVSASNNSGVWNETGAALEFSVTPAYYQTAWFKLLIVAALAASLRAAYRWRVRVLAARLNEVQNENRERRRAEEALRRSEETLRASEQEYRTLFESIDEGFCTIEVLFDEEAKPVDYRFLQVNPSFERQTGIKNAVGRRMREIAPQHEKHWFEIYGRIALTGEPARFENEARQLGRWYDVYAFRLEDPKLRRIGILFNDISERKRAEEELRSRQEMLGLAQKSAQAIAFEWRVGADGPDRNRWSPELAAMYGVTAEAYDGSFEQWKRLIHPEDWPAVREAIKHAQRTGEVSAEYRVVHPDASVHWLLARGRMFFDAADAPVRIVGFMHDVTERRLAEERLRLSGDRYALAMEAASDGHMDWNLVTGEHYLSPRMLRMIGHPLDATFVDRADWVRRFPFHPEDRKRWEAAMAAHFAGREAKFRDDFRVVVNSETRWLAFNFIATRDAAGTPVRWTGSIADITERKRAEDALRLSEERYALAVAGSNEGIFDWDLVSDRVYVSYRAQELFGLPRGELWRPRRDWRHILSFHHDDAPRLHDSIKAHIQGGTPTFDEEYRVVMPGGGVRWYRQRGIALREASGKAYRIVGSIGDVTEKHNVEEELKAVEHKLRQAQRLEAMGTLAGGIAHDFNNILGAILGYGEMALRGARQGSRLKRDLDSIMAAGERGRALVDRVLAFSRSGVGERVPVHVEKVVREALDLIEARLPEDVRIETSLRAGRAAIVGESTQMHQVMMNLGTNAVQAMPAGGTLSVSLELIECEGPRSATVGNLGPGEYVRLTVADNGSGIPQEIMDKIFDPFFTTKETGVGTGLGLSLVHGIVMDLGGAVDVMSSPGAGSTFTVFLPRTGDLPITEAEKDDPMLPHGAGERVLVVDDEEPLVRLTTETLDELGYAPVGFTSSTAALDAFRTEPDSFAAVITDERMPGMSGATLIREVRRIRQSIPILLVSGYIGGMVMDRVFDEGANEVLKKPLSAQELAVSLARVLRA